jgi:hypothetical protein
MAGWTNDRNVPQLLEFMVLRGEVAIAGRQGGLSARRARLMTF